MMPTCSGAVVCLQNPKRVLCIAPNRGMTFTQVNSLVRCHRKGRTEKLKLRMT